MLILRTSAKSLTRKWLFALENQVLPKICGSRYHFDGFPFVRVHEMNPYPKNTTDVRKRGQS